MISLNQLKKTRSSVAALSTLIALQSLYAQSADAQVTFTSTISALTCTISINNASGQSTATVAIGNTSLASGAINVPQYTKLTTPTAFTVGFKGSGGIGLAAVTETCAYTGKLNVAFGKGAANTEVAFGGTRALQRPTTDTIGVGIEIESVNGSTITPIKDFTKIPTYTGGSSLISSQHGLASVNAGTLLNFQATAVKYFATNTAITAGNVSVANRGLIRVKSDKGQLKVAWGDKPDEMCLSSYEIKAHQQALESGYTLLDLTCAR